MRGVARKALASCLSLALALGPALAETSEMPPSGGGAGAGGAAGAAGTPGSAVPRSGALPSGFRKRSSENPWRRFEIIALGAFPLLLMYVDLGFDIGRYFANGFDSRYAPWPFKGDDAIDPDANELYLRIAVAGGASLAFAGADAVIRALRYREEPSLGEAALPETPLGEAGPAAAGPAGSPEGAAPPQ